MKRTWIGAILATLVLFHHQAAAQVAAATTTTTEDNPFRSMAETLAGVIKTSVGTPVAGKGLASMAQSASTLLKGVGSGGLLAGLGSSGLGSGGLGSGLGSGLGGAVTNSDLVSAFEKLHATGKSLGLALPAGALGNWSSIADALENGNDLFTAILPVLLPTADALSATIDVPANLRVAANSFTNLALEAFLLGPGLGLAATSLGLGLAASIVGIVAGALFIAGASVLLGAGVDSLDTTNLDSKYADNTYIKEFQDLGFESQQYLLPATLNSYNVQLVDFAYQVLSRTNDIVKAGQQ